MKHNKTNTCVNTYPSPNKATKKVDSNVNSILINENIRVLRSNKDLTNLKNNNTLHKLENKSLVAKTCKNTQSEILPKCRTPKCPVPFSTVSAHPSVMNKKEESLL